MTLYKHIVHHEKEETVRISNCTGIRIVNFCNNLVKNPKVFEKIADTKGK